MSGKCVMCNRDIYGSEYLHNETFHPYLKFAKDTEFSFEKNPNPNVLASTHQIMKNGVRTRVISLANMRNYPAEFLPYALTHESLHDALEEINEKGASLAIDQKQFNPILENTPQRIVASRYGIRLPEKLAETALERAQRSSKY